MLRNLDLAGDYTTRLCAGWRLTNTDVVVVGEGGRCLRRVRHFKGEGRRFSTFEFSRHSCPFRPKKKKTSSLHSRNIWTTVLSTKYSWFVSYVVFLLLKIYAIKSMFTFTPFFVQKWSWRKFYRNRTEPFHYWKSEVVCVWLDLLILQRLRNFTVGEILEYLCHPSSQVPSVNIGQLLKVHVCVL